MAARKPEGAVAFGVDRRPMLEAAELAADAADKGSAVPVLACVRLQARGGHVQLTGTDLALQVAVDVPAVVEVEGEVLVDARLLVAALKAGEGSALRLTLDPQAPSLRIEGGSTKASLGTLEGPFPEFPVDAEGVGRACLFRGDALQRALARVKDAVSREETRYYLNGAYLQIGDDVRLTTTDGHHLHHVVVPAAIDRTRGADGGRVDGIIPRRTMAAVARLPDSVTLQLLPTTVVLTAGNVTLTSRLVEGTFPDYRRVVPEPGRKHRVELARAELAAAVGRVAWAGEDGKLRIVKLELLGPAVRLAARHDATGAAASTEIAAACEGGEASVGFNAALLASALDAIGGERVTLEGDNAAAPWLLTLPDSDDRFVVMPMRV